MKKEEVPQDSCKSYSGHNKLIYAVDEKGHYEGVKSSGWEVEGFATEMAVNALDKQLAQAVQDYKQGNISALAYYIPLFRFDLMSLAHATGFFQWQIKRHMTVPVFNKLSDKKLMKYCNVFNIQLNELKNPVLK